jgi:hypothetical protein
MAKSLKETYQFSQDQPDYLLDFGSLQKSSCGTILKYGKFIAISLGEAPETQGVFNSSFFANTRLVRLVHTPAIIMYVEAFAARRLTNRRTRGALDCLFVALAQPQQERKCGSTVARPYSGREVALSSPLIVLVGGNGGCLSDENFQIFWCKLGEGVRTLNVHAMKDRMRV